MRLAGGARDFPTESDSRLERLTAPERHRTGTNLHDQKLSRPGLPNFSKIHLEFGESWREIEGFPSDLSRGLLMQVGRGLALAVSTNINILTNAVCRTGRVKTENKASPHLLFDVPHLSREIMSHPRSVNLRSLSRNLGVRRLLLFFVFSLTFIRP